VADHAEVSPDSKPSVKSGPWTISRQGENSDVLPPVSVAVAVTYVPAGNAADIIVAKAASPPGSVVTVSDPR
jgi:hypothetical protein